MQRLFDEVAPKLNDRPGGYTRIIKTAKYRIGDAASIVVLQLVTQDSTPKGTARRSAGLRRKRNERKHQFAGRALKAGRSAKGETKTEATPTATENPDADAGT